MNALRTAWLFFRLGAMNEMQYRVNFFIYLFQSCVEVATGLIGLWLIFSHTSTLGGWKPNELLVVMGVFTLMGGVIASVIQPNMERLGQEIQDGTLDFALTKPEDAQLLVSVREIRIWQGTDVLTGLIVLGIAIARLQAQTGILDALAFALVLALG